MSRQIDTTQPLSSEDEQYLADRGRTPEQEADRQERADLIADDIADGLRPVQMGAAVYGGPAAFGYRIPRVGN